MSHRDVEVIQSTVGGIYGVLQSDSTQPPIRREAQKGLEGIWKWDTVAAAEEDDPPSPANNNPCMYMQLHASAPIRRGETLAALLNVLL